MATAYSTSKGQKIRNRPTGGRSKAPALAASPVTSAPSLHIPVRLRAFLESERDILVKTQSLLLCIAQAMHVEHLPAGPYYPDVVGLAGDLLNGRVLNLDELLLDGRLPTVK